jgi:virginiamycin B lyase
LAFDAAGQLWVTFEGMGIVAAVDNNGRIVRRVDVRLHAQGSREPINTRPHGLATAPDGRSLWFTGKLSNTVGRIDHDGQVFHVALPTPGAVPIYLAPGPDGNMWCTELVGNRIARVTADGAVTEYPIPTLNSRPIAIVPGPDRRSMWFSQEAGTKLARIDMSGIITEFPVPTTQDNAILGGLAFDNDGKLWTHEYVNPQAPGPSGNDYIIRFGKEILNAEAGDLSGVSVAYYRAPSRGTVMHRIVQGTDGNMWFSELALDRVGRVNVPR